MDREHDRGQWGSGAGGKMRFQGREGQGESLVGPRHTNSTTGVCKNSSKHSVNTQ